MCVRRERGAFNNRHGMNHNKPATPAVSLSQRCHRQGSETYGERAWRPRLELQDFNLIKVVLFFFWGGAGVDKQ